MVAPLYRSTSGSGGASGTTSRSAAVPTGAAVKDVMVAALYIESTQAITMPTGWAEAPASPVSTSDFTKRIFWKRLSAVDTGSYTFSWNNGVYADLDIFRYTGVIESGSPWDTGTGAPDSAFNNTASATLPAVSLTTTGPDRLLVYVGNGFNSGTFTQPANYTARQTNDVIVADRAQAVAGSTGNVQGTGPSARMVSWLGALLPQIDLRSGSATATIALSASSSGNKSITRTVTAPVALAADTAGNKATSSTVTAPLTLSADLERHGRYITGTATAEIALGASAMSRKVVEVTASSLTLAATRSGFKIGVGAVEATPVDLAGASTENMKTGVGHPVAELILDATLTDIVKTGGQPIPVKRIPLPPLQQPLTLMAQRILTKEWLDWDLPVNDVEITKSLSGPTIITGRFKPEMKSVQELNLDAWSTYIHAEVDGEIRASGIFMPVGYQDDVMTLEAIGVSTYPHGIPWLGAEYAGILVDPLNIVRMLWQHVQSFPEGNLGVILDNTISPVKLGEPTKLEPVIGPDGVQEMEETVTENDIPGSKTNKVKVLYGSVSQAVWDKLRAMGYKGNPTDGQEALYPTEYDLNKAKGVQPTTTTTRTPKVREVEAKPYSLMWWDLLDIGREIDTLAKATPFDYYEKSYWNPTKTDVIQHIGLAYPRKGTKRFDLRFAQDENIVDTVAVKEGDDTYASAVIVVGSGEGRDAIRGYTGERYLNRLRRVAYSSQKNIKTVAAANALAKDELLSRRGKMLEIAEITVDATHPNAKFGEFDTGDDILVQVDIPWIGEVAIWHRITSYRYRPDRDLVTIQLARSDSFRYGSTI